MILIIDDDPAIRSSLTFLLKRSGMDVTAASGPSEAMSVIRDLTPQVILMDMNFGIATDGTDGLRLLERMKAALPHVPVILMTAWGSIELAVKGMQAGAFDFITKPWNNLVLMQRIGIALAPRNNHWGAAVSQYSTLEAASYQLPYFLTNATSSSTTSDSASQRSQLINMAYPNSETLNPCRAIILSPVGQDLKSLDSIIKAQIPLIFFERPVEGVEYAYLVTGDNEQAGRQAAEFILDTLGNTTPQVLTLEAADTNYQIRLKAFRTQLGVNTADSLVSVPSREEGKNMMLSVLATEGSERINAVYTADDDLALGVLDALNDQGNTSVKINRER